MMLKPPSIWGKLPVFGDFVRARVTAVQVEHWQHWFERYPITSFRSAIPRQTSADQQGDRVAAKDAPVSRVHALPWSFVIPPGMLPFSGRRYVVGALADACDKVGRHHPFVIYQEVPASWLTRNLMAPNNLLFLQARLLARHTKPVIPSGTDISQQGSLDAELQQLWRASRPAFWQRFGFLSPAPRAEVDGGSLSTGPGDVATALHGVVAPPWNDWPRCLAHNQYAWFWRQDQAARYVDQHYIRVHDEKWRKPAMYADA